MNKKKTKTKVIKPEIVSGALEEDVSKLVASDLTCSICGKSDVDDEEKLAIHMFRAHDVPLP